MKSFLPLALLATILILSVALSPASAAKKKAKTPKKDATKPKVQTEAERLAEAKKNELDLARKIDVEKKLGLYEHRKPCFKHIEALFGKQDWQKVWKEELKADDQGSVIQESVSFGQFSVCALYLMKLTNSKGEVTPESLAYYYENFFPIAKFDPTLDLNDKVARKAFLDGASATPYKCNKKAADIFSGVNGGKDRLKLVGNRPSLYVRALINTLMSGVPTASANTITHSAGDPNHIPVFHEAIVRKNEVYSRCLPLTRSEEGNLGITEEEVIRVAFDLAAEVKKEM